LIIGAGVAIVIIAYLLKRRREWLPMILFQKLLQFLQ
jgi:L-2-hydroxyglutarate oxidase LhgO